MEDGTGKTHLGLSPMVAIAGLVIAGLALLVGAIVAPEPWRLFIAGATLVGGISGFAWALAHRNAAGRAFFLSGMAVVTAIAATMTIVSGVEIANSPPSTEARNYCDQISDTYASLTSFWAPYEASPGKAPAYRGSQWIRLQSSAQTLLGRARQIDDPSILRKVGLFQNDLASLDGSEVHQGSRGYMTDAQLQLDAASEWCTQHGLKVGAEERGGINDQPLTARDMCGELQALYTDLSPAIASGAWTSAQQSDTQFTALMVNLDSGSEPRIVDTSVLKNPSTVANTAEGGAFARVGLGLYIWTSNESTLPTTMRNDNKTLSDYCTQVGVKLPVIDWSRPVTVPKLKG